MSAETTCKESTPRLVLLLLAATAGLTAFYMFGAGQMLLGEPDEARCAMVVRHMIQSGDYLAPQLLDKPYFDKPPLFFWMLAGSVKLFGETEWSLRLVPALIGAVTVVLSGAFASRFFNRRAGYLAAATFAVSSMAIIGARIVRMDMLLALWVTATLLAWARAYLPSSPRRPLPLNPEPRTLDPIPQPPTPTPPRSCTLSPCHPVTLSSVVPLFAMYLCMALGCLTKGPVAIALPALIIALYLLLSQPIRSIPRAILAMRPLLGTLIILVLYGSWVGYMTWRYPEYPREFFGRQNLDRLAGSGMNASIPRWMIPGTFIGGLMPWILLFAVAAWDRRPRRGIPPAEKFLWIWSMTVLVIFTISKGRMPNYVLPAIPASFALLGGYLSDAMDQRRRQLWISLLATFVLAAAVVIGGMIAVRLRLGYDNYLPAAIALLALAVLVIPTWLLWKRRPGLALVPFLLANVAGALAISCGPARDYCASRSTKTLAAPLATLDPVAAGTVIMATEPRYGAMFYAPPGWHFRHLDNRGIKTLLPLLRNNDKPLYAILTGGGLLGMLQRDEISGLTMKDRLTILQRFESDALVRIAPAPGPQDGAAATSASAPKISQANPPANEMPASN